MTERKSLRYYLSPRPGTDKAKEQGCNCPTTEDEFKNICGEETCVFGYFREPENNSSYWVYKKCPIHGGFTRKEAD